MSALQAVPDTTHDDRWRVAAGLTVDDRAGIVQVYVSENQRGFAMAGVAAEILLDLLAFVGSAPASREGFVQTYGDRHDATRLGEAWSAAAASGMLVPVGDGAAPVAETANTVALMGSASGVTTDSFRRELEDLGLPLAGDGEAPALIIGLDDVGDDAGLVEMGRALPWAGVPWLPVQVLHERVVVGPFVFPGDTPCFECALTRRAAALIPDGIRRWGQSRIARPDDLDRRAAVKVASVLIRNQAAALLRREPPSLTSRRATYDLTTCTQVTSFVLEVPGCTTCRSTDGVLR